MRRTSRSRAASTGPDAASVRVVVPEGLVLDDIARDRLVRLLVASPPDVAAVAAPVVDLAPGASYRVDAEWRSLDASAPRAISPPVVRGAVAVRPGTPYRVDGDRVTIGTATMLADPGAPTHDPGAPIGVVAAASPRGRSPFPRRPIVCFLGLRPDAEREDWARRFVNRLVRRDIEARLLGPSGVPDGFHLTRPAAPTAESIGALEPDVIVTLDDEAASVAAAWCTRRETTIVEYDPEGTETVALVPWDLARARGRLRARIGRRADAPLLAGLVLRLCAGPQPEAPRDRPRPPSAARPVPAPARRRVLVVAGDPDAPRAVGFVDALDAAGFDVELAAASGRIPTTATDAALVVLTGITEDSAVTDLAGTRRAADRPTVCDLGVDALATDPAVLTAAAARLARECGLVTAPPGAVTAAADALDLPCLAVPTMPSRRRTRELVEARRAYDGSLAVIGWYPGPGDATVTTAVTTALLRLLEAHPTLRIEIGGHVPEPLADRARVARVEAPDPEVVATWRVHLWTPVLIDGRPADDQHAVREAALAGVPTACAAAARPAIAGTTTDALTATDGESPEDWLAVLGHLITNPDLRLPIARRTARRAHAIYGPVGCRLAANRLFGWAVGPGAPGDRP